MARILGLDLGSHCVKGMVVDPRPGAQAAFEEVRRGEGDRAETLKAALTELLGRLPPADQVVVSLPGPTLATHLVSLPFSDPKRVEATLPFEVEGQLPFDLDEAAFDYQPIGAPAADGKTDLLVGVVRKTELVSLLATLAEAGVDPRIVTHPAVAYQNLLAHLPVPEGFQQPVAILDMGHERTSLAIGTPDGALAFARTFAGGGKELTRALAQEFRTDPHEAAHWKESSGAMGDAAQGPDAERASGAFIRGLQPILRELRPSLKAYGARSHRTVGRIFLCGGSAKLPGLAEQLEKDLGIPVEPLRLKETAGALPEGAGPSAMQCFALALRGKQTGPRAPRFNLRRGELAFKGNYDYLREKVGRLAAFAASILILLIGLGIVRNVVLGRVETRVDDQLCRTTKQALGTCEKNYDKALNMLRGEKSPAAALPQMTAVNLLAELTSRIPEDAHAQLDQVVIDLDRITLRGQSENSKQIDTVFNALKGYPCFKDVKQGKLERSRDGQHMSFRFDIQVACPAQSEETTG
jgi:general secretion pathway protein L